MARGIYTRGRHRFLDKTELIGTLLGLPCPLIYYDLWKQREAAVPCWDYELDLQFKAACAIGY
jgi:hypothetical protein